MKHHTFPFCLIEELGNNLFAIRVNNDVELTDEHIHEINEAMASFNQHRPYGVLVERIHKYSFSGDGLKAVGNHPLLKAMAIWIPESSNWEIAKIHEVYPRKQENPLQLFHQRDLALAWLEQTYHALTHPEEPPSPPAEA